MEKETRKTGRIKKILARMEFGGLFILGIVFCIFSAALIMVQANVIYTVRPEMISLMPKETLRVIKSDDEGSKPTNSILSKSKVENTYDQGTILIYEDGDPQSMKAMELWNPVLSQMKIPYDTCEVGSFESGMLKDYKKAIVAITKYPKLAKEIIAIKDWVTDGGNLMIAYPPETSGSFQSFYDLLGILDSGDAQFVEGLHFNNDFLIGGSAHDFNIIDPYDSALAYSIKDDSEVYMQSTDEYPVPLIWRRKAGKGTVVMDNFGIIDKAYRGIHSAAYSLLGDYCAYPVINGAAFYIDDFPSPVPEGDSNFIDRDYHMSVADFYSQVWWNDIYELGKKYGIHYTGLVIEDYSDQVEGVFPENQEIMRFQYFGNMLLDSGGEIGIHGYNHMPLVLRNFDYKDQYDAYMQWPSTVEMKKSLEEVFRFTGELFPDEELKVYVPPSNVLSEEGRELLNDTTIRSIAAVYLPTDMAYEQEFDVSKDGIINTPRITSGCVIDEYMELTALSELNFHFVNTHFHHPDDVLDVDRGAELGWAKLYSNLKKYMDWLYNSAPDIRNLTGSEIAAAVQNYDILKVKSEKKNSEIKLDLSDFNEEAWMIIRLNEGKSIAGIRGGSYSRVAENMYLIKCEDESVELSLE